MFIKRLSVIVLLSFMVSSSVEGRSHSASRHHPVLVKKKAQVKSADQQQRKKAVAHSRQRRILTAKPSQKQDFLATKKRLQRTAVVKKTPSQSIARARPQPKQITVQRKNPHTPISHNRTRRSSLSPQSQIQQKASVPQKKQPFSSTLKKSSRQQNPLVKRAPTTRSVPRNKINYLSLLPFHTQSNVRAGGLDQLWNKDRKGQGQTVAVVELSGGWQQIKDVANGKYGNLPPEMKATYKSNFLTPIGGPDLHPEQMNDWIRDKGDPYHASAVSSVILDLAPHTRILPVSTYAYYQSDQFYDTADALMDLSRRSDVNIINMSSGYVNGK